MVTVNWERRGRRCYCRLQNTSHKWVWDWAGPGAESGQVILRSKCKSIQPASYKLNWWENKMNGLTVVTNLKYTDHVTVRGFLLWPGSFEVTLSNQWIIIPHHVHYLWTKTHSFPLRKTKQNAYSGHCTHPNHHVLFLNEKNINMNIWFPSWTTILSWWKGLNDPLNYDVFVPLVGSPKANRSKVTGQR